MKNQEEIEEKIEEIEQRIEMAHTLGDEKLRGISQAGISQAVDELTVKKKSLEWVLENKENL